MEGRKKTLKEKRKTVKMPEGLFLILELITAVYALSDQALTVLEWDYKVEVPLIKYLYVILQSVDGWGIETIFLAIGLGTVFYVARNETIQKNGWVRALSAFFAVTTVIGISYYEVGSWDYIFHGKLQFGLAVFVTLGYFFIYKNCIAAGQYFVRNVEELTRREAGNSVERFLFVKHPFAAPLLIIALFTLPYVIFYFPGTLQADAFEQLWRFFGVIDMNGHHPVVSTKLMGYCVLLGKVLFQSDSIGLFFYTFPQILIQTLIFSYTIWLICRLEAPILLRWAALLYYAVFPFFQMWGYTMIKDSGYYICTLLFLVTLTDVLRNQEGRTAWWKQALFLIAAVGMTALRNNGRYIILLTLIFAFFLYRKKWKMYLTTFIACAMVIVLVENVYMPVKGIEAGEVGEALSIPLQQTARYIKTHYDEMTEEEIEILQSLFSIELTELEYIPELSDPIKEAFPAHPTKEQYKAYFTIWFQQLLKHPETYIQAFLNQNYGYFYPNRKEFQEALCVTRILGRSKLNPEEFYFDMAFSPRWSAGREFVEETIALVYRMPVVGMLFSAGTHVYLLLGCLIYLLVKKRRREILLLIPSLCVILVCLASPVGAKVRYMLPVMVVLPLNLAWCSYAGRKIQTEKETESAPAGAEMLVETQEKNACN
ncbi:MAG: DUF6020 family protein [Acetatifactor sp.]